MLDATKKSNVFDEIIVINDGSEDSTGDILRNTEDIIFIDLEKNVGKGGAVAKGIESSSGDIIVMIDADLSGLRRETFESLLEPIRKNEADTVVGIIQHSNKKFVSFIQKTASVLSGQQAFRAKLVKDAKIEHTRFGLELALKDHFKEKNARIKKITLPGISHRIKEEKMGIGKGVKHRTKMYKELGKQIETNIRHKLNKNSNK